MKRLDQIMGREAWRAVVINMDHGVALGETRGLNSVREAMERLPSLGVTSVIVPKGLVGICYAGAGRGLGLIVNLSAAPRASGEEGAIFAEGVEEAIKMGADAVGVSMSLSVEGRNVRDLAYVAERCDSWGIPLLVMIDPLGDRFELDTFVETVGLASELGASMVATWYTGDVESFKDVVRACAKPVLVSGGLGIESIEQLKETVDSGMKGGALGVVVGQNMLRDRVLDEVVKALSEVVFGSRVG